MGGCERTHQQITMRCLIYLLLLGTVMWVSCSAQLEAQQVDDDLVKDAVEDVGAAGVDEDQTNIIQEMFDYISPAIEEEKVEELTEENFGLVGKFFRALIDYIPGF